MSQIMSLYVIVIKNIICEYEENYFYCIARLDEFDGLGTKNGCMGKAIGLYGTK